MKISFSLVKVVEAPARPQLLYDRINPDFSLVKLEAPAELQPLRKILSRKRIEAAEDGSLHRLARRLGALFGRLVGDTPHLCKAYGARASEIALAASASQKRPSSYGFFADHVGVDGTTIWAAATSGKNALQMHLLACMLARLWTAQEATAIWVELVAERQSILKKEMEEEGWNITSEAQAAALVPIDELQLSEWDASARAWLQTADEVYKREQTQLMLIVNNLSPSVGFGNQSLYSGVIEVWGQAMRFLEEVVQGKGRRVFSRDVFLGLSAWHIYPDMVVLQPELSAVSQKDSLVERGGVATIGVPCDVYGAPDKVKGMYWGLPLAHLRYYGDAVKVCRSAISDATRISVSQLQQVAFGALLSEWKDSVFNLEAAKIVLTVLEHLESRFISGIGLFALKGISEGVKALVQEGPTRSREVAKLVAYGNRHGTNWLASQPDPGITSIPPCFRWNDAGYMVSFIKDPETRVEILRTLCERYRVADSSTITSYKLDQEALSMLLQHPLFDQMDFITSLGNMFGTGRGLQFGRSLSALAMASEFYNRCLPSSTVSLKILTKPLYESFLVRGILADPVPLPQDMPSNGQPRQLFPFMSRAEMFSLILYFESGTISIPKESLRGVMAISSGNSIFVAGHLLADPAEAIPPDSVQRIPGNIGRPGIALLIPPEVPLIRGDEPGRWRMVEHIDFDGTKPVRQFEGTSVHLTPTGYEPGVDTGRHGFRGREAFFSETRVSVHYKGEWIADLDPLGGIENRRIHLACTDPMHRGDLPKDVTCISLDNWEELLDPPRGLSVVRATGNWIARLSAVAIATQMGYSCWVVRDYSTICWDCIMREARDRGIQEGRILLVI